VKAWNKVVLFSTHRMEEAEYLCDRLLFMRGGKIVARGTSTELLQQSGKQRLTDAFLHFAAGSGGRADASGGEPERPQKDGAAA
jgi:ABC-type multidrug transport system ATPase subunit